MAGDRSRRGRRAACALPVVAVVLVAALAGCGGPGTTAGGAATGPASSGATSAQSSSATVGGTPNASAAPTVDKEITVTVARRKVTPPPGRVQVAKGSTVRITVTSDVTDSMHVHGYDLTTPLPAGVPASVQFRADKDGLFEVETHDTKLVLFQLLVR